MKTLITSALLLAFCAVAMIDASPTPRPAEPDWVAFAARSPLCDCDSCKCDPCDCKLSPLSECKSTPLVVGPPPESLVTLKGGEVQSVQFTQPQVLPVKPQPISKPKPVAAVAKPQAVSYGSCGPGGCGVRRGLFGRRR